MTPGVIRGVRERQEAYDRDPEKYEREERKYKEDRQREKLEAGLERREYEKLPPLQ